MPFLPSWSGRPIPGCARSWSSLVTPSARLRARGAPDRGGVPGCRRRSSTRWASLTSDTHNEMVLMAGSLGVSSLVCLLNNGDSGNTETSQSLLGPFWRLNSPRVENGGSIVRSDTPGSPLFVNARVLDQAGRAGRGRRGRCLACLARRPLREPGSRAGRDEPARQVHDRCGRALLVPHGQDGRLPDPDRRRRRPPARRRRTVIPIGPAHLHALIFKPGFKVLISQVYDPTTIRISTPTCSSASPRR